MHDTPPLALGATFGDGPRLAGGARSAGLADLVGGEGVLDVGKDALLGGAGQLADALKDVAGLADGVLFVVRARKTRPELFQHATESLGVINLVGVVLNDVEYSAGPYAGAYRYYQQHYLGRS